MDKLKYVVIEQNECLIPIIFSHLLPHNAFQQWRPKSAGFVDIIADRPNTILVSTFGKSISLGLTPNPEDAEFIKTAIMCE